MKTWINNLFVWTFLVSLPASVIWQTNVSWAQDTRVFSTAMVRIQGRDGRVHAFRTEVATTPKQQRQGLMFRKSLDVDAAMLFIFNPPRRIAMWMKNTYVPLDMLFAAADGRIVFIAKDTVPLSETLIAPPIKSAFVLEIPAGTAKRLGIARGDVLEYKQ